MSQPVQQIGVIGAGAWGTALAQVAARAQAAAQVAAGRAGGRVPLWMRDATAATAIAGNHQHARRLPGITLEPAILPTADPSALTTCDTILIAAPAQALREVMTRLAPHLRPDVRAIITAKGIERTTGHTMVQVLAAVMPAAIPLVLSGPSFALDVARGLPTAVTLAAPTLAQAAQVATALSLPTFRPYISDDLVGVQVGGAVKNVLAIACGIVTGRGLGDSARAALIARSFAELSRFGRAQGAKPETLAGLSGLGDLVLTCSSAQSRNFALGLALGEGKSLAAIMAGQTSVSEGAFTARAMVDIAARAGIDVPIASAVCDILETDAAITDVIARLMQRPLKAE
jgi:glycerol-3-phosphate dehydrogenase (NAD(P)+)